MKGIDIKSNNDELMERGFPNYIKSSGLKRSAPSLLDVWTTTSSIEFKLSP